MASTKRTLTYDIEFGLKGALNQLTHLRSILQDSVRPDSTSFRVLSSLIQKTQHNVEQLYATMNSSLETSAGAKKYSQDLLKLSDAISDIMVRMKAVRTGDILFSPEESQKLQDLNDKMLQLQHNLDNIKNKTITQLFSGDEAKNEFIQLQKAADILHIKLENVNADEMSKRIVNGLKNIEKQIKKNDEQIEEYKTHLTDLMGVDNKSQLLSDLKARGNDFTRTRIIKDTIRQEEALKEIKQLNEKTSQRLANVGLQNRELQNPTEQFFDDKSVRDAIEAQTQGIDSALHERERVLSENITIIDRLISQLDNIQRGKDKREHFVALTNEQQFQEDLNIAGINDLPTKLEERNSNGRLRDIQPIISEVRRRAEERKNLIHEMIEEINAIEADYGIEVANIFKQLPENHVLTNETGGFISSETNVAAAYGFNTEELQEIKSFLGTLAAEGTDVTIIYQRLLEKLQAIREEVINSEARVEANNELLQGNKLTLNTAQETIDNKKGEGVEEINKLTETYEKLTKQLRELNEEKKNNYDISINGGGAGAPPGGGGNEPPNYHEGLGAAAGAASAAAESMRGAEKAVSSLGNLRTTITNWMGFYQVINMTRSAISSMKNHIQELDQVMTQIAVVTNMTQEDLWAQIGKYSEIARQYGVSIKGVYQVSQIFYQQGGIFLEKKTY